MRAHIDSQLAFAVHTGQRGAVECLVCTYQDQLFGYAVRLLQNRFDAQEVTQDTFIRAYQALSSQYDEAQCRNLALRPWLFRIAHNLASNRRRTRVREEPLPASDDQHELMLPYVSSTEQQLETVEERTRLEHALSRLSRESRELILLRFLEEMSYAEIVMVVGTTEAAVRGKVFRALRQLRIILMEKEADDDVL